MKAFRAALLRFDEQHQPVVDSDGPLLVGPEALGRHVVRTAGDHGSLIGGFPGLAEDDSRGRLIAPGFVDMHVH